MLVSPLVLTAGANVVLRQSGQNGENIFLLLTTFNLINLPTKTVTTFSSWLVRVFQRLEYLFVGV
jgi:hypothetical protein